MKTWIITKIIGIADSKTGYVANQDVSISRINMSDTTCLCRVAGTPAQIGTILEDVAITELTDEQARTTIHTEHPDSDLENLDIADPEIDEIAKAQGLDPHLRADIQIPSRGNQLLQNQENRVIAEISTKKGKSKQFWDDEAGKSGKWTKGIDIENGILDGEGAAHEFVLSRLR